MIFPSSKASFNLPSPLSFSFIQSGTVISIQTETIHLLCKLTQLTWSHCDEWLGPCPPHLTDSPESQGTWDIQKKVTRPLTPWVCLIIAVRFKYYCSPSTKTILCPENSMSISSSDSDVRIFLSVNSLSLSIDTRWPDMLIGGSGCFTFISGSVANVLTSSVVASDLIGPSAFGMGGSGFLLTSRNVFHLMSFSVFAREIQCSRNARWSFGLL